MARVLTLGGVFVRSPDREALAAWYARWLGFEIDESFGGSVFQSSAVPPGGYQLWSPFAADSDYFPREQAVMLNLIVDDVPGALAQVAEGGAEVVGEIDESEFGVFGWFVDPDGNKIELWQPPAP